MSTVHPAIHNPHWSVATASQVSAAGTPPSTRNHEVSKATSDHSEMPLRRLLGLYAAAAARHRRELSTAA
ncbi:hypothetical protein PR202_ga05407 [Eleusine coracana subsp. coracana]|uniref:Uncharacterized protein n=1 Tax=Eleusine coracana subsp. coracana TaxID=191504 RepID=A0AAV5BSI5_ELECO|nr:hypothetical protein PR202_ga04954 [Eleusine coracana subsp. coracana]GJM89238.1 hypothetical protein PR202_ga05407 [Eleusine coracana subsp. coracana]